MPTSPLGSLPKQPEPAAGDRMTGEAALVPPCCPNLGKPCRSPAGPFRLRGPRFTHEAVIFGLASTPSPRHARQHKWPRHSCMSECAASRARGLDSRTWTIPAARRGYLPCRNGARSFRPKACGLGEIHVQFVCNCAKISRDAGGIFRKIYSFYISSLISKMGRFGNGPEPC